MFVSFAPVFGEVHASISLTVGWLGFAPFDHGSFSFQRVLNQCSSEKLTGQRHFRLLPKEKIYHT